MTLYAEIVHEDDIEYDGGVAIIDGANAKRYEPLRKITDHLNSGLTHTATYTLEFEDGTTEQVCGSLTSSGEVEQ